MKSPNFLSPDSRSFKPINSKGIEALQAFQITEEMYLYSTIGLRVLHKIIFAAKNRIGHDEHVNSEQALSVNSYLYSSRAIALLRIVIFKF